MNRSLVSANVVVTANAFNPSVVRESFLLATKILTAESPLGPGFVFSDQVANVPTARFNLLVVPQQLQFAPILDDRTAAGELVLSVVAPLVEALPHTPYEAAGINFIWQLQPEGESVAEASRRLFGARGSALRDVFDVPDAHFGFFASKDLGAVRLKLDIKPVHKVAPDGSRNEAIHCAFNFHRDLTEKPASVQVRELCSRWSEFDRLSEELTSSIDTGNA